METENLCTQKIPQQLHLEGLADFGSPQQKPKPQGSTQKDQGLSVKEKARIRLAERKRKYAQINKDKIAAYKRKWESDNRIRVRGYAKKSRDKTKAEGRYNPERARRNMLAYYQKNAAKIAERKRRYFQLNRDKIYATQRRWQENNKTKVREHANARGRRYMQRFPEKNAAKAARQRAMRKNVTAPNANKKYIRSFYEIARRVAVCLGIPHDVDHIIPIAAGGVHHEDNLQILPASINRSKGAKIAA